MSGGTKQRRGLHVNGKYQHATEILWKKFFFS
jgi:hypothetical protein